MKKAILLVALLAMVSLICVAASRKPLYAASNTMILVGTATVATDHTVTNTFSTAFSAAPVVVVSGGTNDLAHVKTITTTNVIFGGAAAAGTLQWIAVGTP
jgi:hypothetical protein